MKKEEEFNLQIELGICLDVLKEKLSGWEEDKEWGETQKTESPREISDKLPEIPEASGELDSQTEWNTAVSRNDNFSDGA